MTRHRTAGLSIEQRFWHWVDVRDSNEECWDWQGVTWRKGYGGFKLPDRAIGAHRMAWLLANNVVDIPEGMFVCHRCDRPPCCNPHHLFLASNVENQRDMYAKGRGRKAVGIANAKSVLTEDIVREIRQRRRDGATLLQLMASYGMSRSGMWAVISGRTWKHVNG